MKLRSLLYAPLSLAVIVGGISYSKWDSNQRERNAHLYIEAYSIAKGSSSFFFNYNANGFVEDFGIKYDFKIGERLEADCGA